MKSPKQASRKRVKVKQTVVAVSSGKKIMLSELEIGILPMICMEVARTSSNSVINLMYTNKTLYRLIVDSYDIWKEVYLNYFPYIDFKVRKEAKVQSEQTGTEVIPQLWPVRPNNFVQIEGKVTGMPRNRGQVALTGVKVEDRADFIRFVKHCAMLRHYSTAKSCSSGKVPMNPVWVLGRQVCDCCMHEHIVSNLFLRRRYGITLKYKVKVGDEWIPLYRAVRGRVFFFRSVGQLSFGRYVIIVCFCYIFHMTN